MMTHKGHEIREMIRYQKSSELVDKFSDPYKYHCKCVEISIENIQADPMM